MVDNLNQTGRTDILVGWYHSHPGLGCWLSGTDVQTAQVIFNNKRFFFSMT